MRMTQILFMFGLFPPLFSFIRTCLVNKMKISIGTIIFFSFLFTKQLLGQYPQAPGDILDQVE